ncbi:MAG: TIGR00730 family Rossman fold protein [Proteobacteria bacterium]|nr:TIGR00730 family Rossman fold protein [Pseudomonadota bacterium]MBU1585049.1 TIGR00730 family Rossman fold protein [Pseudomonadota bacterium]MBU2451736.1 TIGR00730 family Rossman fold protein [Pseudomonadota bacterium]MBU2628308.1 TIGR00730 family Rossman fold protein [Pseudomonadota bacterium]
MKRICVFCGSSPGSQPEYVELAAQLGKELAKKNIGLVYGGGSVGMMGVLATSVVKNNGDVTGVITRQLFEMEVGFTQLSDLRIVESMHERKALMAELSDGFIALPGGFGTLDEMFEILTWSQLNIHRKPCGFLNVNGYYNKLIAFIDHMILENFVNPSCRELVQVDEHPARLLEKFYNYMPILSDKGEWARKLATVNKN